MDGVSTLSLSSGFIARYANRIFAEEDVDVQPLSADGSDLVARLVDGTVLGHLVHIYAARLKLDAHRSVKALKASLLSKAGGIAVLFAASNTARELGIHPDMACLLLHRKETAELVDTLSNIVILIATSTVRGLEQETLTPVPFASACIGEMGAQTFCKSHELDDGTTVVLARADLYRSSGCARAINRAKSAATFHQNPHRLHASSIRNHAILILLSWMNYLYIKLNNLPRVGEQYYSGFNFSKELLRDFGNSVFGTYKLMGNEGNVPINLEPYPALKEHFLATKGNVDSFFRVTFSKKHSYQLMDFLVFTASFKCPFHDLLLSDEDFFGNSNATIIVFSHMFAFCQGLAYVVAAKDMTKKLTRTRRITLTQKAKMYDPVPFERLRASSARATVRKSMPEERMAKKDPEHMVVDAPEKVEAKAEEEMHEKVVVAEEVPEETPERMPEEAAEKAPEEVVEEKTLEQISEKISEKALEQVPHTSPAVEEYPKQPEGSVKAPIVTNWPEFEVVRLLTEELLTIFPGSALLRKLAQVNTELYDQVTTSTLLRDMTASATSLSEFCARFRAQVRAFLGIFSDLFIEIYTKPLQSHACDPQAIARCKYFSSYDGDVAYFLHIGLAVLLRQVVFVMGGVFCPTCNTASPDSCSFNEIVSQRLRELLKDPRDQFDALISPLSATVQRCLALISTCDANVDAKVLRHIPALPNGATPPVLPLDVYHANIGGIIVDCIISYSLCIVTSSIDSFEDISESQWEYFVSLIDYLKMSHRVDENLAPTTDFAVHQRALQFKHFDIVYRNYMKRTVKHAMKTLRDEYAVKTTASKQAERLQDFALWKILNALDISNLDLNSTDVSTYNKSYYWVIVLEGVINEIEFLLSEIKSTATEGIKETGGGAQPEASQACLFVAPLQRTTFQYVCNTITLLFNKLYQANNISVERFLLSQLLAVLIQYQDFGLAKLMEGADILLLAMLNTTDPKQLMAILRIFSRRTQSTIYFSNPFSALNVHKGRGKGRKDVISIQPPDGHTIYLKLSQDSSSDESSDECDKGARDIKKADTNAPDIGNGPASEPAPYVFDESSDNYHIQILKPLMNRFKEIVFSYSKETDVLRLFGKTLKVFFGAFPLKFSNALLESVVMIQMFINLYQSERFPGLFYVLLPLTPYISLADKDIVYADFIEYVQEECNYIKTAIVELIRVKEEKEESIDAMLNSKKLLNRILLSIEVVTLFAESYKEKQDNDDPIIQYFVKSSILFTTIMSSSCQNVLLFAGAYISMFKSILNNETMVSSTFKASAPMLFSFQINLLVYLKSQGNIQLLEMAVSSLKQICDIKDAGLLEILFRERDNWVSVCANLVQISSSLPIKTYVLDALIEILVVAVDKARVSRDIVSSIKEAKLSAAQREKIRAITHKPS